MIVVFWTRTQGPGDTHYKDGDIYKAYEDNDIDLGEATYKRWGTAQIDDWGYSPAELTLSDYNIGADGNPVVYQMRQLKINYVPKLTPEQLESVRDPEVTTPTFVGVFSVADIVRKR